MTVSRTTFLLFTGLFFTIVVVAQPKAGSQDPDSLFFHSVRLQRTGHHEDARIILRGLLDRFPLYHDARLLYGRLLAWDSQFSSAMVQIDSVLFFQPTNVEARLTKAQILGWSKRYRQAADILLALSEENPTSGLYKAELAKVYLWGGSPRRALEQYEQAYLRNPESSDVLRGLARTHRQLRSFELSRYWYEKLLERVPGDAEAQAEIVRLTYRSNVEVQIQGSYEGFSSSGVKAHSLGQVEVYASPQEDWKPFLHFSRVSKFSENDIRYGLGSYVTLNYSLMALAQGIVSPNARIAPDMDLLAELNWGVADGFELIGGYRYVKFDSAHAHILQPGATWYMTGDAWLTVKVYVGLTSSGATTNSTTAAVYYSLDRLTVLRVGAFTGTEAFRATTFNELSALKTSGGFAALKSRVSKPFAIEVLYQYTARNSPSDSHLALVTLSFLF